MNASMAEAIQFEYANVEALCSNDYLVPVIRRFVESLPQAASVIDLGCGNGSVLKSVLRPDLRACGVDASVSGIDLASKALPQASFHVADAAGTLPDVLIASSFDAVISTETIEHLMCPRSLVKNAYNLLKPGGALLVSTPYHGYLKNVILSLTGSMDAHFTALWDGGHVKFWSRKTLCSLLSEAGFEEFAFAGAGRVPFLWKSMIIICRKPQRTN
jgi:2-polyprenyl-3-methyl-5-hydroxy-6-metoxy-1,4-benzoquinol methylase